MQSLEKLRERYEATHSLLCIGLDSDISKIPEHFQKQEFPQFEFNKWIIDQTHQYALAYKPNTAFYEARGSQGWKELEMTMEYLQKNYPDIFTICDAKRGDIGSTNQGYVTAIFDQMSFDSVTINPYVGKEGLQPFLDRKEKVSIILCHTSNEGAGELQEIVVSSQLSVDRKKAESLELRTKNSEGKQEQAEVQGQMSKVKSLPLWQVIAGKVTKEWNENDNCMLVVGATYPEQLKTVRQIVGDMWILVPGIGAQGGELEKVLENGLNSRGNGVIINSSRGIIFSDSPKNSAKQLATEISSFLDK